MTDYIITFIGVIIGGTITAVVSYFTTRKNLNGLRESVSIEKEAEGLSELNSIIYGIHEDTLNRLNAIIKLNKTPDRISYGWGTYGIWEKYIVRDYRSMYHKYAPFIGPAIYVELELFIDSVLKTQRWINKWEIKKNSIETTIQNKQICYSEMIEFYSYAANYAYENGLTVPLQGNHDYEFFTELQEFYQSEENRDRASFLKKELIKSFDNMQFELAKYVQKRKYSK